jgi:hypothetical protein
MDGTIMNVDSISVTEGGSTTEIKAWFDSHPQAQIQRVFTLNNYLYIVYE